MKNTRLIVLLKEACFFIFLLLFVYGGNARAQQYLYWDDAFTDTFTTFTSDTSVTIVNGAINYACDGFSRASDIYVIPSGSVSDKDILHDVSNGWGLPNTIVTSASGGIFINETIGYTSGIGNGRYAVVYDECQDGLFDKDVDFLLDPAFEVNISVNLPPLSDHLYNLKLHSNSLSIDYLDGANAFRALCKGIDDLNAVAGCILEPATCVAQRIIDNIKSAIQSALQNSMTSLAFGRIDLDPKDAAYKEMFHLSEHYGGIAADPPDPDFRESPLIGSITLFNPPNNAPLTLQATAYRNAAATENALAGALLTAIERYQGARLTGFGDGALLQAQNIKQYARLLAAQLPLSNSALTSLSDLIATLPWDPAQTAEIESWRNRIRQEGFNEEERSLFANLELSNEIIKQVKDEIISGSYSLGTPEQLRQHFAEIITVNEQNIQVLDELVDSLDDLIYQLQQSPSILRKYPVADAGGPYSAVAGIPVSLDGSGSSDHNGTVDVYEWDLDRDGEFDDATGPIPSVVFQKAFDGLIGLRITNSQGWQAVSYTHISITGINSAPTVQSYQSEDIYPDVEVGGTLIFSVTPEDADNDTVTVRWYLDGSEVAAGTSYTYNPTSLDTLGLHLVTAVLDDDSPFSGSVTQSWMVSVLTTDGDHDLYRANVDCDDTDPEVHPGQEEIIDNGKDDDCDPSTYDLPPIADFNFSPAVWQTGEPVRFSDTSAARQGAIVDWSWDFGDGTGAVQQNPVHIYDTAGTYTVVLTITDGQGAMDSISQEHRVLTPPKAAFSMVPTTNVARLEDGAVILNYSSSFSSRQPELAIDSNEYSSWYSDTGEITDQWITVGLLGNQSHVIDHIVLKGSPGSGLRRFDLLVSNSGTEDQDFHTVVSGEVPQDSELHKYDFSPVQARCVKLLVHDSWGADRIIVSDFQVWTRERHSTVVSLLEGPPARITAFSSRNWENSSPEMLLDDRSSTGWTTQRFETTDQWVTMELPGNVSHLIGSVMLRGSSDANCPRNFSVRVSATGTDPNDFTTIFSGILQQNNERQEFTFFPVSARYVQLVINTNYGGEYINVAEFEILAPDGVNIALSGGVGAMIMESSSSGSGPERAIDYNSVTSWDTTAGYVSNQWMKIRLMEGGPYLIDSILLKGRIGSVSPRNFQILVSTDTVDDADFVPVFNGILPQDGLEHEFFFPAVEARYVQLILLDNYGGNSIGVSDFKVFSSRLGGLTFSADDLSSDSDGEIIQWSWDFGDGTLATGAYPIHTYAHPGTYQVSLTVTDEDDLSDTISFEFTALVSPILDFTWSPEPALETGYTELSGSLDDPDGTAVAWSWSFDYTSSSISTQNARIIFPDNGDYSVTLTVTDNLFRTVETTRTVNVNNVPPAVVISDQVALVGDEVILQPTIRDAYLDINTLSYSWKLGNGDIFNERNLAYAYDLPGEYNVSLSVTDKDGDTGTGHAVFTINKRPTTMQYIGNISGDPGNSFLLRAKLIDDASGAGIPDCHVTFTVNNRDYELITNRIGIAEIRVDNDLDDGDYSLMVEFPEDNIYLGSSDQVVFSVPALTTIREPGYSSMIFTISDVLFFSYHDNTFLKLYNDEGNLIWDNDGIPLNKGEHAQVAVAQGVYRATGTKKFSVLTGDPVTKNTCGYYAMDQNGYGTSKELYTWVPSIQDTPVATEESKFIVFAAADNTHVLVEETDTGVELADVFLDKGEHWEVVNMQEKWLHVVADKPVSALISYDQGFFVPSSTGKWSGVEFYTYVGYVGHWDQDLTVMSFGNNNQVSITNTETGEILWSGILNSGMSHVEQFRENWNGFQEPRQYITVQSTGTVTVAVQPWVSYDGESIMKTYNQGAYLQNNSGSGIGFELMGSTLAKEYTYSGNVYDGGYLYVLGYVNDTLIDLFDARTGEWVDSSHVNRGQAVEINPGNGLWRIRSDKYISAYSGWGEWSADFSPVEFGDIVNPMNLSVDGGITAPACAAPGETLHSTICFDTLETTVDLHQVGIRVHLADQQRFVSADNGAAYDELGNYVTWNLGMIPASTARRCVKVETMIDARTPLGITLTNRVDAMSRETTHTGLTTDIPICTTVNHQPGANDDAYTVLEDEVLTIPPPGCLANDTDPDNDQLTAEIVTLPENGQLQLDADGGFIYQPNSNFYGRDSFSYRAVDAGLFSEPATVVLTVTAVNDPPVADAGGPYSVAEGTPLVMDGSGSNDPDNDALTLAWDCNGDGIAEQNGSSPSCSWSDSGIYTVTLFVSDGYAQSTDTATVTVINAIPMVNAGDDISIQPGEEVHFNGSFIDPGDDSHSIIWDFGDGSSFSGTLSPSHTYISVGEYIVTLTVTDNDGASGSDRLTIRVAVVQSLCGDIDHDNDVDGSDRNLLRLALGTRSGDSGFLDEADYDGDGLISYNDYRYWYSCYKTFISQ